MKFPGLQQLEAGDATVEEETGNAEFTAPAIQRVEGGERSEHACPDEAANKVDVELEQDRVEEIRAGGITHVTADVDWVLRPERNPEGEIFDVGDVEREIAEIVRRLHLELVAIVEERASRKTERRKSRSTPR